MSLTQKKICLINLKVLTDEVLLEMKKESSKLLILRFINNVGCKKAIELSNKPRRTYFRALNRALKEFESLFYSKILNNKSLYESLNGESFLEDVFEKINLFEKKSSNEDCFLNYSDNICSFIVNKIKKIVWQLFYNVSSSIIFCILFIVWFFCFDFCIISRFFSNLKGLKSKYINKKQGEITSTSNKIFSGVVRFTKL